MRETEALEEDLPAEFNGLDWLVAALFRAAEEMLWELEVAERRTLCNVLNPLDCSGDIELVVASLLRERKRLDWLATDERLCEEANTLDFSSKIELVVEAFVGVF